MDENELAVCWEVGKSEDAEGEVRVGGEVEAKLVFMAIRASPSTKPVLYFFASSSSFISFNSSSTREFHCRKNFLTSLTQPIPSMYSPICTFAYSHFSSRYLARERSAAVEYFPSVQEGSVESHS